jgi:hypothetical protein
MGQKLVINLRMLEAGLAVDGGNPTYTVSNAHMVIAYTSLDAPRKDLILKSNISPISIIKNISYQMSASESMSLQIPTPKGAFVRRLLVSLIPRAVTSNCAVNTIDPANSLVYAAANAKYKAPLIYNPIFGLSFIQM